MHPTLAERGNQKTVIYNHNILIDVISNGIFLAVVPKLKFWIPA